MTEDKRLFVVSGSFPRHTEVEVWFSVHPADTPSSHLLNHVAEDEKEKWKVRMVPGGQDTANVFEALQTLMDNDRLRKFMTAVSAPETWEPVP